MTEIIGIDKRIIFKTDDEKITNIFIVAIEKYGFVSYQIKFSIRVSTGRDAWFLINSINPLKVFGGNAGTFVQSIDSIMCQEYEIINFVISKATADFYDMAKDSKHVQSLADFH